MRHRELIRRADLALSDLTNDGGILNRAQQNRFIRRIIDSPTVIRDARTLQMNTPEMELNKIGFGSRVLRAARNSSTQRSGPYDIGNRALLASERAKPDFGRVILRTSEIMAEINLPYETLEDNIEREQMRNTILSILGDRVALDLEELFISGDTDNVVDPYLALQDGVLALAQDNIVNHGGAPINVDLFKNMAKALPTQYMTMLGQYKTYLHPVREIEYRAQVAQRQTNLGDAVISGKVAPTIMGVPLAGAAKLPLANAFMTIPRNLIVGFQRNIRMEYDTNIRERVFVIVLTMRVAFAIEETEMVVKATNIGDE